MTVQVAHKPYLQTHCCHFLKIFSYLSFSYRHVLDPCQNHKELPSYFGHKTFHLMRGSRQGLLTTL